MLFLRFIIDYETTKKIAKNGYKYNEKVEYFIFCDWILYQYTQYENKKDYFLVYRCFILQFFVFLVQIWDSIHPKTYEYKTT